MASLLRQVERAHLGRKVRNGIHKACGREVREIEPDHGIAKAGACPTLDELARPFRTLVEEGGKRLEQGRLAGAERPQHVRHIVTPPLEKRWLKDECIGLPHDAPLLSLSNYVVYMPYRYLTSACVLFIFV